MYDSELYDFYMNSETKEIRRGHCRFPFEIHKLERRVPLVQAVTAKVLTQVLIPVFRSDESCMLVAVHTLHYLIGTTSARLGAIPFVRNTYGESPICWYMMVGTRDARQAALASIKTLLVFPILKHLRKLLLLFECIHHSLRILQKYVQFWKSRSKDWLGFAVWSCGPTYSIGCDINVK